jgi:hypothetical protein
MTKRLYREGDLFAVPLRDHGYALGLVARCQPRGRILFGYFFSSRHSAPPKLSDLSTLAPDDAVLRCRFGDLGIAERSWPVLGQLPGWNREIWKMPAFVRVEALTGHKMQVIYSDADPSVEVGETGLAHDAETEPKDGLAGSGFVELRLTNLVNQS